MSDVIRVAALFGDEPRRGALLPCPPEAATATTAA